MLKELPVQHQEMLQEIDFMVCADKKESIDSFIPKIDGLLT